MKHAWLHKLWYEKKAWAWLLSPFSYVYRIIAASHAFVKRRFFRTVFDVPVIVVGNLTVGGVGKTPLVIALAEHLKKRGLSVGIVSRGYGARLKNFPYEIKLDDVADKVGDEPLLLAQKTNCPVVIAPKRVQAVEYLLKKHTVDVVISDDGLQHAAMGRTIEIVVIDGKRGFGNGFCLPAGPLRESVKRLKTVDFVVVNGEAWPDTYAMALCPDSAFLEQLPTNTSVAAIAGIGHPERFFDTLKHLDIQHKAYAFPDHHRFRASDLNVSEDILVMTEKDAVKCRGLSEKPMYVLPVRAHVSKDFWGQLDAHDCFQN